MKYNFNSDNALPAQIASLRRDLDKLIRTSNLPFAAIDSGQLRSGDYVPSIAGWALNSDGSLEVNEIVVRSGAISNSALADPVGATYAQNDISANGYVAVADTIVFSYDLVKPVGYTTGMINFGITAVAKNTTGADDYLNLGANIDSEPINGIFKHYTAGEVDTAVFYSPIVTALPYDAEMITIDIIAYTSTAAWTAQTDNKVSSTCTCLWLR